MQGAEGPPRQRGWAKPLAVALLVTVLVTVLSAILPDSLAATGVGGCFFLVSYALVLRHDSAQIRHFGLSFGGLAEPEPLVPARLLRAGLSALAWSAFLALIIFPFFWLGYVYWWQPAQGFDLSLPADGAAWSSLANEILGQLLVIALPEEMFYRGYLQTALDDAGKPPRRVLGAPLGAGVLVSSAVFAVGHLATIPSQPSRLAVFFPALLFGWLRARTGGVGAAVFFHAACNLFATLLARGYGLLS